MVDFGRIQKELREIENDKASGVTVEVVRSNPCGARRARPPLPLPVPCFALLWRVREPPVCGQQAHAAPGAAATALLLTGQGRGPLSAHPCCVWGMVCACAGWATIHKQSTPPKIDDNLQRLVGSVPGPKDTPYDGGLFKVSSVGGSPPPPVQLLNRRCSLARWPPPFMRKR